MSHANAALTPRARLRLARLIVDHGWPVARAAERYDVSWPTAKRWADRYRAMGAAGMADRSCRPHRVPNRTPHRWSARSCTCGGSSAWARSRSARRCTCRPPPCTRSWSAAGSTGSRTSTGRTGEPIRRYEHDHPGALIHVDVKKLGNIPDGGGWRYVGRQQGGRNRAAHPGQATQQPPRPAIGTRLCTPSSTTTPASPTPRSTTTNRRHRPACCAARWPGSPPAASPSSGCSPTTAPPTVPALGADLRRAGHHAQEDPALPAPDQRQDRTLPPHPGRRLGLQAGSTPPNSPPGRPARMAPPLQSPPAPHRDRQGSRPSPA